MNLMKEVDIWADEMMRMSDLMVGAEKGFWETDLNPGTAMGWTIYKSEHVQVIRAFISAGGTFPLHEHLESVETLVLYLGDADVLCEDDDCVPLLRPLEKGKAIQLDPGKKHKIKVRTDSRFIATFIPPDAEMPG